MRDKKGRFKKGAPNPTKGKTSRINICTECGVEFVRKTRIKSGVRKGQWAYSRVKYCAEHKHLSRWNSKRAKLAGKKSARNGSYKSLKKWRENGGEPWNKGKTFVPTTNKTERIRFRNQVIKKVLKRDNYTCQLCGKTEYLQVDHIQDWSDYVEGRFDISNCRALCMWCHYFVTYNKPLPKGRVWGHTLSKWEGGD